MLKGYFNNKFWQQKAELEITFYGIWRTYRNTADTLEQNRVREFSTSILALGFWN